MLKALDIPVKVGYVSIDLGEAGLPFYEGVPVVEYGTAGLHLGRDYRVLVLKGSLFDLLLMFNAHGQSRNLFKTLERGVNSMKLVIGARKPPSARDDWRAFKKKHPTVAKIRGFKTNSGPLMDTYDGRRTAGRSR
jgi:hypothetical protein